MLDVRVKAVMFCSNGWVFTAVFGQIFIFYIYFCRNQCLIKNIMKKYLAEMIGTMVLVLMGCGSAVFAGSAAGAVSAGVGTL